MPHAMRKGDRYHPALLSVLHYITILHYHFCIHIYINIQTTLYNGGAKTADSK